MSYFSVFDYGMSVADDFAESIMPVFGEADATLTCIEWQRGWNDCYLLCNAEDTSTAAYVTAEGTLALLKSGVVIDNVFEEDDELFFVPTPEQHKRMLEAQKQVDEYLQTKLKKARALGISFYADEFTVGTDGAVRLSKANPVNGVYYIPEFVARCGYLRWTSSVGPSYISCFGECKGDLKVVTTGNKITDMSYMFADSDIVNLDLTEFNVTGVVSFADFCKGCRNLQHIEFGDWNTGACRDMNSMFNRCNVLSNLNIGTWNVSNVETMAAMFEGCAQLRHIDLSAWNTGKLGDISRLFDSCTTLQTTGVEQWDVSSVWACSRAFCNCFALYPNLWNWNLPLILQNEPLTVYYCIANFALNTNVSTEVLLRLFGNPRYALAAKSGEKYNL